jgi:hypothetical protein
MVWICLVLWATIRVQAQQRTGSAISLTGTWQGVWKRPQGDSRSVVEIVKQRNGWSGRLFLVDQPGLSMDLYAVRMQDTQLTYKIRGLDLSYKGTLSGGGNAVEGYWKDNDNDAPRELNLTRVTSEAERWEIRQPTIEELHQYLEISYGRSILIGKGAPPFHLTAQAEIFKLFESGVEIDDAKNSAAFASMDELWRDPLHWRLTILYGGKNFTEVVDGETAYTSGEICEKSCSDLLGVTGNSLPSSYLSVAELFQRMQAALFIPYRPALLTTRRLALAGKSPALYRTTGAKRFQEAEVDATCLATEPDLAGVPNTLPLARTKYCLSPIDLTLLRAEFPNNEGYSVELYDAAPFGPVQIPRTIVISEHGKGGRMRVTSLERATDFGALDLPIPAGAKLIKAHSQETLLADDLMRGQQLPWNGGDAGGLLHPPGRTISTVSLNLHVDTVGRVTGLSVSSDNTASMTTAAAALLKQWTYRVSYQGDHVVPVDQHVTLWSSTP